MEGKTEAMNTHYIPRLLLRQFAVSGKVNTYDFTTSSFATKKVKNTFALKDSFDPELEAAFAKKLEGPFGDLLNHKLLSGDTITIDRRENMLMRKFKMINFLRAPIINGSWDEMIERTRLWEHPAVQAKEFLSRHHPELRELFEKNIPSKKTYISDLKKAMEIDSLEDIANSASRSDVSHTLALAASHGLVTVAAFWDSSRSGQEFILPKLPGISQMDQVSISYKALTIRKLRAQKEKKGLDSRLRRELDRLEHGSLIYCENFSIYPISPTRVLIFFSPYFRAFFPIMDSTGTIEIYPPLLEKKQFDAHFFEPMRMELFKPCRSSFNRYYQYSVKNLTADEVMALNALLLDMETEEFVFHDYNRIRDSFWYYDKTAKFAFKKKHDFSHLI